jgi:DNA primase catalytic core
LRQRGYALVVEGYMDVVALAQAGFENAVATLGTACTADHVQKLFRFTDSVVFSFDGDSAGRRAALRALEASLPHATDTRTIRFLFLPPEHDPDSFVREMGAEAFERSVSGAVPLSRQLLEGAAADCDRRQRRRPRQARRPGAPVDRPAAGRPSARPDHRCAGRKSADRPGRAASSARAGPGRRGRIDGGGR